MMGSEGCVQVSRGNPPDSIDYGGVPQIFEVLGL